MRWDIMTKPVCCYIRHARLMRYGDPKSCVMELGREALRLESSNNVIVVVILLHAVITNSGEEYNFVFLMNLEPG